MKLQCIILILYRKFDKFTAELHPVPVTSDVWHTIGAELIGPLPMTPRGNKYIMTVLCYFSKHSQISHQLVWRNFYSNVLTDWDVAR